MIRNYFKTALRTLLRNRGYAAINVTGLAVGVAACLLIYLITSYHQSFDSYHTKKDRIYRAYTAGKNLHGESDFSPGVPFPAPQGLRNDFPELANKVAGAYYLGNDLFTILDEKNEPVKRFRESSGGVLHAEPQLFEIFDHTWLAGNPTSALSDPNKVVLTRSIANKYFGQWEAAMGRFIKHQNTTTYQVAGIIEDLPSNTDLPMSVILSYKNIDPGKFSDWVSIYSSHQCFLLLPEGYPASRLGALLPGFVKKHKPAENISEGIALQALTEMHYETRFGVPSRQSFSRELITALTLIGGFLLVIACVNFINLATAQAVNRSKEVGVRKVLGSNRRHLITQFMGETFLITVTAVVLATGLAWLTVPALNSILNTKLSQSFFNHVAVPSFLFCITLLVTVLAGFYPALVLSGFNPIMALKTKMRAQSAGGLTLRRSLVVFQFAIAQVLIIGMLVVVGQMKFFKNASLGFTRDHILSVPIPPTQEGRSKIDYLRSQLSMQPGISQVSFSFTSPSEQGNWSSDFRYGNSPRSSGFEANLKWADADYFKTFDITFIAGRPYFPSDTIRELVVSQTLLTKLGIRHAEEALGKKIDLWDGARVGTICGVVKDFHTMSLREALEPVIIAPSRADYRMFSVRLKPENAAAAMAFVEKLWTAAFPEFVYEYQFLDEKIDRFYRRETQLAKLYTIFAGIAVFISCLGLYGLVSFMATQRIKEVGIRKVLGASVSHIVFLFSREFTLLVVIAFAIAAPVAWYLMSQWLQDFEYRIPLGTRIFSMAIGGSVLIAWLTVGYKAVKAALTNPVKSLRSE